MAADRESSASPAEGPAAGRTNGTNTRSLGLPCGNSAPASTNKAMSAAVIILRPPCPAAAAEPAASRILTIHRWSREQSANRPSANSSLMTGNRPCGWTESTVDVPPEGWTSLSPALMSLLARHPSVVSTRVSSGSALPAPVVPRTSACRRASLLVIHSSSLVPCSLPR